MFKRRWDFRYENDKCDNIETICPGIIDLLFHDDIWRDLYLKHFLEKWTHLHNLSKSMAISY